MINKVFRTPNIPLKLLNMGNKKYFKKNEIFIRQGEIYNFFYILVKGKAVLYSEEENGSLYMGSIFASPCIIASQHVMSQKEMKYSYKCIEDSEFINISRNTIIEIMKTDFEVNMFIYNVNTNNFFNLVNRVHDYSKVSSERRVILLFIEFVEEFGVKVEDKIKINFKFTQQFISDLVNVERSTAVRTIKKLKEMNIIEKINGYYYIKDINLLKEISKENDFFKYSLNFKFFSTIESAMKILPGSILSLSSYILQE